MSKIRLDIALVDGGFIESREKAKRLILAGKVLVDEAKIDKCGTLVSDSAYIKVLEDERYVSRGGLKLEKALLEFKVETRGKIALDSGASTGGFTDCLLKNGITKVFAVDVGYGQLAWKLRTDPRVKVIDRTNIRTLKSSDIGENIDLAVLDLSFISLKLVLSSVHNLLVTGGKVIALIKPQFEVGKGEVGKGGIVRSKEKHENVIQTISLFAEQNGFADLGVIESPITGNKGNKEFLIYLEKQ